MYGDSYIQGLLGSQNVIISTASGSSGPETITIDPGVNITWGTYNLTFSAGQNIIANNASFTIYSGNLTLETTNPVGSQPAGGYDGIYLSGFDVLGQGNVNISGVGGTDDSATTCNGVTITSSSSIQIGGVISITGYGGGSALTGGNNDVGVLIEDYSVIAAQALSLSIHGTGGTYTGHSGQANSGIVLDHCQLTYNVTNTISGTPGGTTQNTYGVVLTSSTVSGLGDINISGSSIALAGTSYLDPSNTNATNITGNVILTSDTALTCSGTTTFSSTIASSGGNHQLTISNQQRPIIFNGNIGSSIAPLGTISCTTTTSSGIVQLGGISIYATSVQCSSAPVQLLGSSSIYSSGNQQFESIASASGANLILNSSSGSITAGNMGSISAAIGNITITAGSVLDLSEVYANSLSITTSASPFSSNGTMTCSGNCSINANGINLNHAVSTAGNLTLISSSAISVGDSTYCTSSGTGTISMTASGNISIGNSALVQIANGDITLLAGTNITSGTSSTVQTTSASGNITIVCDNNNPTPPSVGSGYLSFGSGTILCTNNCLGGGKVLLYTTKPGVNTLPSTINATSYTPGSYNTVTGLYVPGTNEYVGYWYNVPPYPPDPPFEVIYKSAPSNPPIVSPTTHQQVQVATIQSTTTTTTTVTNLNMSVSAGQSSPTPAQSCKGTPAISIRAGG